MEHDPGCAKEKIESLLPGNDAPRSSRRFTDDPSANGEGIFSAIPLPLEAILDEFSMSLVELENLSPGDEIPLNMPVDTPLRVGKKVLAHGVLGTMENQLALKLTRLAGQKASADTKAGFEQAFTRNTNTQSHPVPAQAPRPEEFLPTGQPMAPYSSPDGQKIQGVVA